MATDQELKEAREALPAWTQDPATPAQVGYVTALVKSRVVPTKWLERIKELTEAEGGLKKGDAGKIIQNLKALPVAPGQDDRNIDGPTIMNIPPGYYAIPTSNQPNDFSFYRVKELRRGGHRIILQVAGPQEFMLTGGRAADVIKRIIRFGIGDAAVLYGRKVGRCSQCHKRLTNRLSRELAVGPVCGGRVYAEGWEERVNNARTALRERGLDPNENVYD